MVASLGNFKRRGQLLIFGGLLFPIFLVLFALVNTTWASLLVLVGVGWSFMVFFNMLNTVLQSVVSDELRGRVMSVYTLAIFGGMPIGALLAGIVAEQVGEPLTIILGSLISFAFMLFVSWKIPQVRQLQ